MYWYTLTVNCKASLKLPDCILRVKVFFWNKRDPKLLKIFFVTQSITLDSRQPLPFPRVWRQRGAGKIQIRGTCVCTWLLHEQPRALAGLRQTRSCSDDPCLENANKSGTEAVWCLGWKYFYPSLCLCFTYTMNPEKIVSIAVDILPCSVMW